MNSIPDRGRDLWGLFAVLWASSVLFHLVGNTRLAPEWGRSLLGIAAIVVLARPRVAWLSLPLAGAVVINVWLEAPRLGNHWLLQGLLAVLVAASIVGSRGRPEAVIERLMGPARLTLLAFYAFAAFAKLNADFFDPVVSCAVFYLRETADSWNAGGLVDGLSSTAERGVAGVVAFVELSVPVLLYFRRTRRYGVLLALVFHFVLALDRSHQFFDFSSILTVFFVLFLDGSTRLQIVDQAKGARAWLGERWSSGPEIMHLLLLAALAGISVFAAGPSDWSAPRELKVLGVWTWIVVGLVLIAMVTRASTNADNSTEERLLDAVRPRWLMLIPVLTVVNGLTPYLELKTGHGWNMYSNLAVVDGESNHFLLRSGLPLTDGHARLVDITESNDRSLAFYIDGEWLLPEQQLVDHLAAQPEMFAVGLVDGEVVRYDSGGDPRPQWRQKLQVFRAVDAGGSVSCQPSFGPAR